MKISVVDYGVGNLHSVRRALESIGADVAFIETADEIAAADRLLVPGVGAFEACVDGLRQRGLIEPIKAYAHGGRPLLGICVGMQMLLSASEEFGLHQGLDLIPGQVRAVPSTDVEGRPHKIPHIGWTELTLPAGCESWRGTPLAPVDPGTAVYFVHSFTATPVDPSHRLADAWYGGRQICAALRRDNIVGLQFHPEKSGPVGLSILRAFLSL
jgi:glutamine amidotransferase